MNQWNATNTTSVSSYQWLIRGVIYLLAAVSAGRGLIVYSEQWPALILILSPLALVIALEKLIVQHGLFMRLIYVLVQLGLVSVLFVVARYGDFWSLLLLPMCYVTPKLFEARLSILVIALTITTMTICLWFAEGGLSSLLFSSIYLVAFSMVFGFSKIIMQLENSRENAEALSRQLETANQRLRIYSEQSADNAAIQARHEIARDLHDSVTQTLFSLNLMLSTLLVQPSLSDEKRKFELEKIQGLSESAMKELREIMGHLKPTKPLPTPFTAQLHQLIEDMATNSGLNVKLIYDGTTLPPHAIVGLMRVIREALMNVVKHAGTKQAELRIQKKERTLNIIIKDKGEGFDPTTTNKKGHLGLENIQQHCLEIGAKLSITSSPKCGCSVSLQLPLNPEVVATP